MRTLRSRSSPLFHLLPTLLTVIAALTASVGIQAQEYPARPVRIICVVQPGGAADLISRLLAQKYTEKFGQSFIVDNRTGQGPVMGADPVAKSPPDGYTLLLASITSHGIGPHLYNKMPFDAVKDFAPIGLNGTMDMILVVPATLPIKSVPELIALSKSRSNGLAFASGGTGGLPHLMGELFKTTTGANIQHVPYRGSGPAATDLAAGQVQMAFDAVAPQLPFIQSGRTKILAVTSPTRMAIAPDAPTMTEIGYPQVKGQIWYGLVAPAGTPKGIVDRLNAEANRSFATQDVKEKLAAVGIDPAGDTPEQFAAFIRDEIAKWGPVVKAAGIVPE
jgi:tripartite-type tricarboxylate transporter receptor subunit TctC